MHSLPEHRTWHTNPWFPNHNEADKDGLLMLGGSLEPAWLIHAYNQGIFPWFNTGDPILWWTPDPRMVVKPEEVHISKSMRTIMRKQQFEITYNKRFLDVVLACQRMKRSGQADTWITNDIVAAYHRMNELGHAVSVEVWFKDTLVGGLYGIDLKDKGVFCGESMFTTMSNASKAGFIVLAQKLQKQNYKLIDCQMYTNHLASLGATLIPRDDFLSYLK